ncbi:HmuY family protein [Melittangium boletus]|uniref:HmuY family protein n=1 Tax=Melittangium boletus TaxID=83453 RepID=UPI003DA4BB25
MRRHDPRPWLGLVLIGSAVGCAPDLREDYPFDGQTSAGPLVEVTPRPEGGADVIVDATSKTGTVYVDLDEGREMKTDEALDTNGWDLAFQRFTITTNGGGGNPTGEVRVAVLTSGDWDGLTTAPASGYQQDASETVFNGVQGGWYNYDLVKHQLQPRESLLYVVRSSQGRYFKLKMRSYYDSAGTPARLSFQYQAVAAP